MKFKRLVMAFIIGAVLIAFFTKPSEADFKEFIQPVIKTTGNPPVIEYQDNFLYAKVVATFVNTSSPVGLTMGKRPVAPAFKEEYIGLFKKYWKVKE